MHDSRTILVFSDSVKGVLCEYERDIEKDKWEEFKTFDTSLKKGDLVIAETDTRHGFTVVKVKQTDYQPDVKSHQPIRWIFGKVDAAAAEQIQDQEKKLIDAARAGKRKEERAKLRASMGFGVEDEIANLEIVSPKPGDTLPAPESVEMPPSAARDDIEF